MLLVANGAASPLVVGYPLLIGERVFPFPVFMVYYSRDNPRLHQLVFALCSKARLSSLIGVYLVAEGKGRG